MHRLNIGDIIQNSTQRSIVRWLGEIEDIPIIGLQSTDSTLPGYTDGTCPFDNNRYFNCPNGQGYYILETGFNNSYEIIQKKRETSRLTSSDDDDEEEFNSPTQSLSASPVNTITSSQPIPSVSSPVVSQTQHNSDNSHLISPSRGILCRLTFEREQRKNQISSPTNSNKNSFDQTPSIEINPQLSRRYQPENYRSTSYDEIEEPELTTNNNEDENEASFPSSHSTITGHQLLSNRDVPVFGYEYFLNAWTFSRVINFIENQIPIDNQLCLNVYKDQYSVQIFIDEQIKECLSPLPSLPPKDVRIELIKLYNNVQIIFPSRAISLYENDYLLLAILCSNNNCAYIRTSNGWAYTDDEDDRQPIVVDEISQMIDGSNDDIQNQSEQCRHMLQNASFLYYKLVE